MTEADYRLYRKTQAALRRIDKSSELLDPLLMVLGILLVPFFSGIFVHWLIGGSPGIGPWIVMLIVGAIDTVCLWALDKRHERERVRKLHVLRYLIESYGGELWDRVRPMSEKGGDDDG